MNQLLQNMNFSLSFLAILLYTISSISSFLISEKKEENRLIFKSVSSYHSTYKL